MQPLKADLHCHTTFSDGTLTVEQLLQVANERQLHGLSITDHDTIAAYETALPLAKTLAISLISGIEISAEYQKKSIHVLGYAFDLQHPELRDFCLRLQENRAQRNVKILERLAACKFPIALEELYEKFGPVNLGRPHIAKIMVAKGYVKTVRHAFDRYLGDQGRCYVAGFNVEVPEAIALIQRAGGFAVLAHPHYLKPKKIVEKVCEFPFDGIEVYYGLLSPAQEQPWLDLAKKKNWFATGGSDFHGAKKSFQLGCSWTPEETFAMLAQRFAQHHRIN